MSGHNLGFEIFESEIASIEIRDGNGSRFVYLNIEIDRNKWNGMKGWLFIGAGIWKV